MTLSMYQLRSRCFCRGSDLFAILDKAAVQAAERKIDPAVLLNDRLAPDMFTFTRQVQIACDHAKGDRRGSPGSRCRNSTMWRPPLRSCSSG